MFGLLTSFNMLLSYYGLGLLTETTATFDIELVRELMDVIVEMLTKLLGLFKIFPLNLFMIIGIMFLAISIFRSLKRTAK